MLRQHMNTFPISANLYRLFLIVFLCLFGSTYGYMAIFNFEGISFIYGALFFFLALGLVILGSRLRIEEWLDARIAVFLTVLLILPLQLYIGAQLEVKPSWDFGYVYKAALSLLHHDSVYDPSFSYYGLDLNGYFESCPNNLGMLVLLTAYFKLLSFFREPDMYCGIVLNIVFIDIALLLFTFFIRKVFSNKRALMGILIWITFLPFWLYIPIFYTDTITLPLMMGSIYLLYEFTKANSPISKILYGLLTGIVLCIGMLLKTSVAILLVAILIYLIFVYRPKKAMLSCALVLAGFLSIYLSFQTWSKHTSIVDMSDVDNLKKPYSHYLMMGLYGVGEWNPDDTKLTMKTYGAEAKKEVTWNVIKSRLEDYGPLGYVDFLYKKATVTWGDGTYFSCQKLQRHPIVHTALHDYVTVDGLYYKQFKQVCNGAQLLLLSLMLVSIVSCFIRKEIDLLFVLHVTMFGIFLFLLLWETRSRYLVNFVPFLLIIAIDGLSTVYRLFIKMSAKVTYKR